MIDNKLLVISWKKERAVNSWINQQSLDSLKKGNYTIVLLGLSTVICNSKFVNGKNYLYMLLTCVNNF